MADEMAHYKKIRYLQNIHLDLSKFNLNPKYFRTVFQFKVSLLYIRIWIPLNLLSLNVLEMSSLYVCLYVPVHTI